MEKLGDPFDTTPTYHRTSGDSNAEDASELAPWPFEPATPLEVDSFERPTTPVDATAHAVAPARLAVGSQLASSAS